MAKQIINIGSAVNDKSGDPLRTAFQKVNANFTELYNTAAADATDRLVNGDAEVVLDGTGQLTFPGNSYIADDNDVFRIVNNAEFYTTGLFMNSGDYAKVDLTVNTLGGDQRHWVFDRDGSLTLPGDLHGAETFFEDPFGDPVSTGYTLNVTPAPFPSSKKFSFRVDQTYGDFHRAYLDMPIAETNKQVGISFNHSGGSIGYIFNQGTNTNDDGLNNAFNIFANSTNIKLTAENFSSELFTWTFGNDGILTLPAGGDIVDSEGETVLGFASTSYSLSDVLSTILAGATTSGFTVTGDATATFPAGTEIQFESLAGAEFTVGSSSYDPGPNSTTVFITDYTGFGPVDGDKIYIEYHGVQEIYAGTGISLGVTDGNSGRVLTIAAEPATVIGITSSATTTYHVSTSFSPPNGDWNWSNWDGMREIGGFTPNATFYSVLKGIQPGDNITVNETDSYVIDYITTGGGATGYFHIFITSDSLARFASISSLTFDIVNVTLTGNTTVDNDLTLTGKLTFPNSTVQTTAYREVAAPATSKGASGDQAGQIAFDNNYIYRCTANYTFGETDIWSRVALDSTPWPVMYTLTITTAGAGAGIVTSTPAGIDSGTLTATFVAGTVVNLSASAAMGSVFAGWAGPEGVSGLAPVVVTMNSNISVTATFDIV